MGETERLTSIPYPNLIDSSHMGVLLDITPNHWRYPTHMRWELGLGDTRNRENGWCLPQGQMDSP